MGSHLKTYYVSQPISLSEYCLIDLLTYSGILVCYSIVVNYYLAIPVIFEIFKFEFLLEVLCCGDLFAVFYK